jgi:branched-chain amino acid aminotransferase
MIYLNGAIVARDKARIDLADRGLLLGDGLFETLRAYRGKPFRLADHLGRLERSAATIGIPLPVDAPELAQGVGDVLAANKLQQADASLRITLTRGVGPRGLLPPENPQPTLMVTAAAYQKPVAEAMSAVVVGVRRNEGSPLSQLKSLNYLDNILAAREAAALGADEAIMLNNRGQTVCGARANLFAVLDGVLVTPPLADGALGGITRHLVLEVARNLGIEVAERSLLPADLERADELLLTNSLLEIVSIGRLGNRDLPERPIAAKLRQHYRLLINPM